MSGGYVYLSWQSLVFAIRSESPHNGEYSIGSAVLVYERSWLVQSRIAITVDIWTVSAARVGMYVYSCNV
jgi:hypothetical protein